MITLIGLNLIPHLFTHPLPVATVGGFCLVWRLLYEFQKISLPGFFLKFIFVGAAIAWVQYSYGQIFGLEPGSLLLILGASLKLIDRSDYHDTMVLLFLVFFLVLVKILDDQSLWMTLFASFNLIVVTSLLVQLHSPKKIEYNFAGLLKTGTKLLLQAGPFIFVLFFVFPRLSNQWGLLGGAKASTGFSDELDPGSISELSQSDEPAFRVHFKNETPAMKELYWVGATLGVNKGMRWEKASKTVKKKWPKTKLDPPLLLKNKKIIEQKILLESKYGRWVFLLDQPKKVNFLSDKAQLGNLFAQQDPILKINPWGYIELPKPVRQKVVYRASSVPRQKIQLTPEELNFYLQYPEDNDPRLQQFVQNIETKNHRKFAIRTLSYFKKNFRYTQQPGLLKSHNISELLFDKKVGFCEHFAATFADLARRVGIPSRIVIGFHGGEKNELDNYLIVKDADAHSWVELWSNEDSQWHRYDPTGVVAPLRLQLGGQAYFNLNPNQRSMLLDRQQVLDQMRTRWSYRLWQRPLLYLDSLSTRWNLFMLTYDKSRQQDFLANFGLKALPSSLLFLISLFVASIFFFWSRHYIKFRKKKDPLEKLYKDLGVYFGKKGFLPQTTEGPETYLKRLTEAFPEQESDISNLSHLYQSLRYGPPTSSQEKFRDLKALYRKILRYKSNS